MVTSHVWLVKHGSVESPHVLITDDFNNWTGHLLAIQIDSLQQRLQPAHVTFNVGIKEGKNLTYNILKDSKHPAEVKQITTVHLNSAALIMCIK